MEVRGGVSKAGLHVLSVLRFFLKGGDSSLVCEGIPVPNVQGH